MRNVADEEPTPHFEYHRQVTGSKATAPDLNDERPNAGDLPRHTADRDPGNGKSSWSANPPRHSARHGKAQASETRPDASQVNFIKVLPRWTVAAVLALSGVGGLLEAGLLILIVQTTTKATSNSSSSSSVINRALDGLTLTDSVIAGSVVAVLAIALQVVATRLLLRGAANKLNRDREQLVTRYFEASIDSQSLLPVGTVPDLAANAANRVADAVVQSGQTASSWVNLAVLLVAAVVASPWAALAMMVVGGAIGLSFTPITKSVTQFSRRWVLEARAYNGFLAVYTRMFLEVRVFGVAPQVEQIALGRSRLATESWRRGRSLQTTTPIIFRNAILLVGFLCIGITTLISPGTSGGVAITALLLVRGLVYVQTILTNRQAVRALAQHGAVIETNLELMQQDSAVWGDNRLTNLESIRLVAGKHSYFDGQVTFDDVNIQVRRGQFVALTGPSGGGKTTLLKVLMRTVEPSSGQLFFNDLPAAAVARADWYSRVAYLAQEVRLIPGTVADNVRFFREATDSDVGSAVAAAALQLDPHSFPKGLDTVVEQEGLNLSGGQRQRIGLARCLLLRPQMLVLDEPTSALDSATEVEIMKTIDDLRADMIVVMVTHRASTVGYADTQYEMDRGRLSLVG